MLTHCLACGSADTREIARATDTEYFTSPEEYAYLECGQCLALSIDPVPKDRLAEIYPDTYYSYDGDTDSSFSMRVKNWLDRRFFARLLSQVNTPQLSVLDVGGGSGVQLSTLRGIDARVSRTVIVDLNSAAQEAAINRGHEYFCGPFEQYRDDAKFDVILMLNLIEHVDNPGVTLARASELLNPGGIVVIKTPNTDSLDAKVFRTGAWGGYHCPRHWVLFNRDNLLGLAQRSGLDTAQFSYQQGAPFWATSVMTKLYRRGWVSMSAEMPVFMHPLCGLLVLVSACFDVPRSWFFKTSQMLVVFKRSA